MQEIDHVQVFSKNGKVIIRQYNGDNDAAVVRLSPSQVPVFMRMLREELARKKNKPSNDR